MFVCKVGDIIGGFTLQGKGAKHCTNTSSSTAWWDEGGLSVALLSEKVYFTFFRRCDQIFLDICFIKII